MSDNIWKERFEWLAKRWWLQEEACYHLLHKDDNIESDEEFLEALTNEIDTRIKKVK